VAIAALPSAFRVTGLCEGQPQQVMQQCHISRSEDPSYHYSWSLLTQIFTSATGPVTAYLTTHTLFGKQFVGWHIRTNITTPHADKQEQKNKIAMLVLMQ